MANIMIESLNERIINLGNVVNFLFAYMGEVAWNDWYSPFGRVMLYVKLRILGVSFTVYNEI